MEHARIEQAPNGSVLTYITIADAMVKYIANDNKKTIKGKCIFRNKQERNPEYSKPNPANISCPENAVCLLHLLHYSNILQNVFSLEVNAMNLIRSS